MRHYGAQLRVSPTRMSWCVRHYGARVVFDACVTNTNYAMSGGAKKCYYCEYDEGDSFTKAAEFPT